MAGEGEQALIRVQCGVCKTMLACEVEHRHKPMTCPVCNRLAPLVYVSLSPGEAQNAKPVHELPVAKPPGAARTVLPRLLRPVVFFLLGFLAYAVLYALDYGRPIDRIARNVANAVREELGATPAPIPEAPTGPPQPPTAAPAFQPSRWGEVPGQPGRVRLPPMPGAPVKRTPQTADDDGDAIF